MLKSQLQHLSAVVVLLWTHQDCLASCTSQSHCSTEHTGPVLYAVLWVRYWHSNYIQTVPSAEYLAKLQQGDFSKCWRILHNHNTLYVPVCLHIWNLWDTSLCPGLAPDYISELLCSYQPAHSLTSSGRNLFAVSIWRCKIKTDQAFAVREPHLLPDFFCSFFSHHIWLG